MTGDKYSGKCFIRDAFCFIAVAWSAAAIPQVISGDPAIDVQLIAYEVVAGGGFAGIDRGSDVIDCNSATAHPLETTCPNDATYAPSAHTGGYQAWGVGMTTHMQETWELDCGWTSDLVWEDGQWVLQWGYECDYVPILTPGLTTGRAIARLIWGETPVVPSTIGSGPLSTLAFRPSNLTSCAPYWLFDLLGECLFKVNSSYVEDAGYEAKIVIDDPSCQVGLRDGVTDGQHGCFIRAPLGMVTNLPASYIDTTKNDPPGIFNASVGSADAASIEAGTQYGTIYPFASGGNPQMLLPTPKQARHTGSITSDFDVHPVCIANFDQPPFCFFGIDTASVGGPAESFVPLPSP